MHETPRGWPFRLMRSAGQGAYAAVQLRTRTGDGEAMRAFAYREGGSMIMQQNRGFATPSIPHPGQPKPNPAYLDQYGGYCKRFWGQVGEVWPSWCQIWVLKTAISLY